MIFKYPGTFPLLINHRNLVKFYFVLKKYLPEKRLEELVRSWGMNNLIRGPRSRKKLERKWGCRLPNLINISPTERCNLNCLGCFASSHDRNQDMPLDKFEKIITDAKKMGTRMIGILGGEPLLRKDILPILEKHKDVAFRISTNGTQIDHQVLDFLKRSGHVILFFSLEGLEEETDYWRGKGIYRQIKENMLRLKEEKILFGFSSILHSKNKDVLVSEEFLDEMERLGNKIGIFFPYGPGGETQHFDLMLSAEEKRRCFETLEGIEQKYSMVFKAEGYISAKKPANYFLNQGCRAGINIHITPEGFVEPCNGIQFHTGNIFETTLEEIVRSPFYRDIYSCALKNHKSCIIIHESRQVYDILQKHNAAECHGKAYDNLHRQMEYNPCKPPPKTGHANMMEGVN